MKRVGITTFHWGTNYGGVLQSYALQDFLNNMNYDVKIINYAPVTHRDNIFFCFKSKSFKTIFKNLREYLKELKFRKFRKNHLFLTERYINQSFLKNLEFDIYVTGSDQIWNTISSGGNDFLYFLPFKKSKMVKKISYAASFGIISNETSSERVINLLKDFDKISVREDKGYEFLKKLGFKNLDLMPDPTLLKPLKFYQKLAIKSKLNFKESVFVYALQNKQHLISKVVKNLENKNLKIINTLEFKFSRLSIEDWLNCIMNSKYVITNSFHGVIFSIIFETPFVVVPIEGKSIGMNSRIETLLRTFKLEDRLLSSYCEKNLNRILSTPLDSDFLISRRNALINDAKNFVDINF